MKVLDQKHLLKQAVDGMIPASIKNRHKQPYRAPDGKSFFASSPEYLQEMLCEEQIKKDGLFQASSVTALMQKFKSGKANSEKDNMALIGILSTQLLLREFISEKKGCSVCKPVLPQMCVTSS